MGHGDNRQIPLPAPGQIHLLVVFLLPPIAQPQVFIELKSKFCLMKRRRNAERPATPSGGHVQIALSRGQLETLLKMVYLGNWVVNGIRAPDNSIPEFEELEQFVSAIAHRSGLEDIVDFEPRLRKFFLALDEKLQPFIDEYDDEAFWDGLVDRLADRDFAETYGDAATRMGPEERFEKIGPFVDKYETEIERHGVDRLRVPDDTETGR